MELFINTTPMKILDTRDMVKYFVRIEDEKSHAKTKVEPVKSFKKEIAALLELNKPYKSPLWRNFLI